MKEQEFKNVESEAKQFIAELQNANKHEITSFVTANEDNVIVTVILTLGKAHRPLDVENAKYILNKFKKKVRPLKDLRVYKTELEGELIDWNIMATLVIDPIFCRIKDVNNLAEVGKVIVELAENRLTEPDVIDALNADCEPWFREYKDEEDATNNPAESKEETEDEQARKDKEAMDKEPAY